MRDCQECIATIWYLWNKTNKLKKTKGEGHQAKLNTPEKGAASGYTEGTRKTECSASGLVAALPQASPEAPAGVSPSHHLPSLSFSGTVVRRSYRILKKRKKKSADSAHPSFLVCLIFCVWLYASCRCSSVASPGAGPFPATEYVCRRRRPSCANASMGPLSYTDSCNPCPSWQ